MVNDPFNPSQSVGPDDTFTVTLDEHTAPVATMLRNRMRDALVAAKTMEEYTQAVNDTLEAIYTGMAWFEYRQGILEARARVDDE